MPQRHICEILLGCLVCAGAGGITLAQTPVAPNANVSRAHERWLQLGRNLPGSNSAALRQRAIQQRLRMRVAAAVNPASASVTGWTSLGPLPLPSDASGVGLQDYNWVTGRATSIVIDPNDPSGNTVYAGGAYAGVWKSTNAGPASPNPSAVAWTPLTDNQPTLAIGAIAVQPQVSSPDPNASVIVAGTGETDGADSYYGLGILRSADAGQNWTLISQDTTGTHSFAGLGFSSIAFSSTNPNLVVAATAASPQGIVEGLENPVAVNRGIYYSTDGGISWNAASLNDAGVSAASDSVTSVAFNASAGLFYAAVRFHGIYSSSNGSQWSRLPTQPGAGLGAIFCPPRDCLPAPFIAVKFQWCPIVPAR